MTLGSLTCALLLVLPLVLGGRRRKGAGPFSAGDLTFVARDIWALDQFCASAGRLLSGMPKPRAVHIDLRNVPVVDRSSVACLRSAVSCLDQGGIVVSIRGCAPNVAATLTSFGVVVESDGSLPRVDVR